MKITSDPNLAASKLDRPIPYFWQKQIFDFCLALLLLILLSPLFLVIFLASKLESLIQPKNKGPFLYSETRISQGRPFKFYKIRIFKISALKKALAETGFIHTKPLEKDSNNLILIGGILKRFYLDELPQLFNILKGEMSFVGTRPWNTADYSREIKKGIFRKKAVKAGITGLVQITKGKHHQYAGGDLGLDDYYINFCRKNSKLKIMLLDLKIIALSILKLLKGESL